jgi:hypothetical protein
MRWLNLRNAGPFPAQRQWASVLMLWPVISANSSGESQRSSSSALPISCWPPSQLFSRQHLYPNDAWNGSFLSWTSRVRIRLRSFFNMLQTLEKAALLALHLGCPSRRHPNNLLRPRTASSNFFAALPCPSPMFWCTPPSPRQRHAPLVNRRFRIAFHPVPNVSLGCSHHLKVDAFKPEGRAASELSPIGRT